MPMTDGEKMIWAAAVTALGSVHRASIEYAMAAVERVREFARGTTIGEEEPSSAAMEMLREMVGEEPVQDDPLAAVREHVEAAPVDDIREVFDDEGRSVDASSWFAKLRELVGAKP
jgi:hypothetical protein